MSTTTQDFYQKNIALLQKHHPEVWQTLCEDTGDAHGKILPSPDGKPNLRITTGDGEEITLHDHNDPEAEIPLFLNMIPADSTGVVVLIGMGLGYTPLAILRSRPNIRHLAVFDLEPGVFKQALHAMDLSPALSDRRLILGIGHTPPVAALLAPAHKALQLETIHNLQHLPSFALNRSAYMELNDTVYQHINSLNVSGQTSHAFGAIFTRNRLSQLTAMHRNSLLEDLQEHFAGVPAFLVAAGPSLDKNIHLLPQAKNHAVIFAADAALPALLANGVTPHFVAAIDPQEIVYEKIADSAAKAQGTSLICTPWVSPEVPKCFPADDVFWSLSARGIDQWLNTMLGGKILTSGAGTVAHLNLTAAIILGCSPIVFVGQDLAFSNEKDHASGIVLNNPEQIQAILNAKKDVVWVDGVNGDQVPTNRSFLSMKTHFEEVIAATEREFVNATEGGAHIKGAQALTLQEAIDQYCTKTLDFTGQLPADRAKKTPAISKTIQHETAKILETITSLEKTMSKADHLTHQVLQGLTKATSRKIQYRAIDALPMPLQKKIQNIDEMHKKIDGASKIWRLVEEVTMEGLKISERLLHEITNLADNPNTYQQWLTKALERFLFLNQVRGQALGMIKGPLLQARNFHRNEAKLIREGSKKSDQEQNLLELAKLYFASGNMNLARPVVRHLLDLRPDLTEALFYNGAMLAHQLKFRESEESFSRAQETDIAIGERIEQFRRATADSCLKKAAGRSAHSAVFKKLLFRGLRYCADHPQIRKEILALAQKELPNRLTPVEPEANPATNGTMDQWRQELEENDNLRRLLTSEQTTAVYFRYGQARAAADDTAEAVDSYRKALEISPDAAEIHFALTEAYFAIGELAVGGEHLARAVQLDSSYAKYWEEVGDSLGEAQLYQDALAAFEQCFMAMPHNLGLLKKIGDCYLGLGQPEAAHEAYRQLKEKLSGEE